MFRKILCSIDFSPGSQLALRAAARLAGAAKAELVITHVVHVPAFAFAGEYPLPPDAEVLARTEAERGLADAEREAVGLGVPHVSTRLLTGVPWDQIVEAAREHPPADLVVLGSHGRTGLSRFLLGSVAEKVVRHAPCSVLVARGEADAAAFRHVLCLLDFSDGSRAAAARTGELAAPGGEGIEVMHVIEAPVIPAGEPLQRDFLEDLDRRSAHLLGQWATHVRATTAVPVSTRIRIGRPAPEALAALEAGPRFDLVVTGSHGRTGIQRALLGSVAEKIVRHAPCSVLVARD